MQNNTNTPKEVGKKWLRRLPFIAIVGSVAGAVGGYIYYAKVGCVSGTCGITSNPWMSTAWGGILGYLVFDVFKTKKKPGSNSAVPGQPEKD